MSFCVKVFCQFPNGKQETRRFRVGEQDGFLFLHQKIKSVFKLNNNRFNIKWIDEDEDEVDFTDDAELDEALRSMNKQRNPDILYLNVIVDDDSMPTNYHDGIECDECNGPIRGFRYKCLHCDDYDLCMACEGRGNHKVHHMIRIPKKDPRANVTFAELKRTVQHGPSTSGPKDNKKETCSPPPRQTCPEIPRENIHRRCHRRHMNRGHFWNSFSGADGGSHRWNNRHRPHFGFDTESLCSEATRAAEEARSLAMKHATDIMKGIWTGWVGDQNQTEQTTDPTPVGATATNQEQSPPEGVTIDITLNKKDGVKHRCSVPEIPIDDVQPVTALIEVIDLSKQDGPKDNAQPMETNATENSENVSVADDWDLVSDTVSLHSTNDASAAVPPVTSLPTPEEAKKSDPPTPLYPSINTATSTDSTPTYMNQRIQWAMQQMILMGYSDEGGLLTRLLQEKNGNINETLDAIMSGRK